MIVHQQMPDGINMFKRRAGAHKKRVHFVHSCKTSLLEHVKFEAANVLCRFCAQNALRTVCVTLLLS